MMLRKTLNYQQPRRGRGTQRPMKRIALTGGIGTGKTHVLRLFRRYGIPTLEADQVSRAAVDMSQPCCSLLRKSFGEEYFLPNGQVNRAALARLVFDNQSARTELESIVHPVVRRLIDDWFSRCNNAAAHELAIAEIPLLFETNRAEAFDGVLVVSCPPDEQLSRIMKRDSLSLEDARKRLLAQLPIGKKIAAASWVIRTDRSLADTARQVEQVAIAFRTT
jgi:dephospho-CoA kinase